MTASPYMLEFLYMDEEKREHEALVRELNNEEVREEYAKPYNDYKVGPIAGFLGWVLVASGNLVYGKKPSYTKFKAVEVIARIPYQSWEVATYTLLTALYSNEKKAIELSKDAEFTRIAQDNETMHVVVISQIVCNLGKQGFFRHILIPIVFAFFYFWTLYILYLLSPKSSMELNYLFESHAYKQYGEFLKNEGDRLRATPICSDYLEFYGRNVNNEYELFESIRNDELVHRNRSIRHIEERLYNPFA